MVDMVQAAVWTIVGLVVAFVAGGVVVAFVLQLWAQWERQDEVEERFDALAAVQRFRRQFATFFGWAEAGQRVSWHEGEHAPEVCGDNVAGGSCGLVDGHWGPCTRDGYTAAGVRREAVNYPKERG